MTDRANRRFHPTLAPLLASVVLAASMAAAQDSQPGPGGPHEGIKVHGHWTIEVRNPDGTLVTRREFENSLQLGAFALGPVLGRMATVGNWVVGVYDIAFTGPCLNSVNAACYITESTDSFYVSAGTNVFKNLTVSAPFQGSPGAGTLTLNGTFTVQAGGQIGYVATGVEACAPTVAPANCPSISDGGNGSSLFFSDTAITPIPVTVGQLVQVTVVFSFS